MNDNIFKTKILILGAGDLGSGILLRLYNANFRPLAHDLENPLAIRRTVAFCSAIKNGAYTVENVQAYHLNWDDERTRENFLNGLNGENGEGNYGDNSAEGIKGGKSGAENPGFPDINRDKIPVITGDLDNMLEMIKPEILVDARMLKKPWKITRDSAPFVMAIGPGLVAGRDCHILVETKRGHRLGRLIKEGSAQKNTGIPGEIQGKSDERVIHSPACGTIRNIRQIGEKVEEGDLLALIGDIPITAPIRGVLRGLISDGTQISKGLKIGDIDPRNDKSACFTVSDKALSVAGGILEGICQYLSSK